MYPQSGMYSQSGMYPPPDIYPSYNQPQNNFSMQTQSNYPPMNINQQFPASSAPPPDYNALLNQPTTINLSGDSGPLPVLPAAATTQATS